MVTGRVSFFLNGEPITIEDPKPDLLLLDYLRSPEVGLTGAKKGCGEGGCGACTVILSRWDKAAGRAEHRSINSCLRPVCALGGMAVTTVEGTGYVAPPPPPFPSHAPTFSRGAGPGPLGAPRLVEARRLAAKVRARHALVAPPQPAADTAEPAARGSHAAVALVAAPPDAGMNPVAYRLAANNGTQCGYCSTGFVMNMSALLAAHPAPTKRQIEDAFDGNLCRCTGYRPILTAMKTFASNWTPEDEAHRMKCLLEDGRVAPDLPGTVSIPFPPAAQRGPEPVATGRGGHRWVTPETLDELVATLRAATHQRVRMVHGNTSFGVYPLEFQTAELLVDLRMIPALSGVERRAHGVHVGAATTFSELIEVLEAANADAGETTRLGALLLMARRTAGTIVRNAATLAGNTMMVLSHVHAGEPFPSDSLTALDAIDAEIEVLEIPGGARSSIRAAELVARVVADPRLPDRLILLGYTLPRGRAGEVVLAQKVALREVNAHAIVNATTRLGFGEGVTVDDAVLVFGGIAPHPWRARATEALLRGRPLALADYPALAAELEAETRAELARVPRRPETPWEGFTDEYRVDLVLAFLYKAIVNALLVRDPDAVPPEVRSAGVITWGRWPDSSGRQHYMTQAYKQPVGQPYIKLTAMLQTSGQLKYTHEIPLPPLGENGAFVQSLRALASFAFRIPGQAAGQAASADELRDYLAARFPAFTALVTAADVPPQGFNYQGMGLDQPLFAEHQVRYVGQSLALVLARTEQDAIEIASYVTQECVSYGPPVWKGEWGPEWYEPVLSLDQAIAMNSVYPDCPAEASYVSHVWKITRPGSRLGWVADRAPLDKEPSQRLAEVDGVACRVVESTQASGGQIHFYFETQACVVEPLDDGGLVVQPSSQSPMEMHQTSAMAIGAQYNKIQVQINPVGGGYGGKTEPARFVTGPAVVAAHARHRPIRIAMPRAADSSMIGKRHPYYGQVQLAVDLGERRDERGEVRIDPEARGLMRGFQVKLWGDGGAFYDCSFIVANCIQLRADNAYRIPNFQSVLDVCRTNTAPNTAMRAFGDIQGKLIVENAVDDAAFALGIPDDELREKNMYDRGDVTPFGQALSYCYMKQVWSYLKKQCDYVARRQAVDDFNAANRWRKRGIAMLPNKYGSGYNLVMLEQAAAVVSVYSGDGSILINQGGVEMGQGLLTQATQVAAYVLGVPMELISIQGANTAVIPNPTSSGASTGTPYAGEAVKRACEALRGRLVQFAYDIRDELGEAYCRNQGIDFWNYGTQGWAAEVPGTSPPRLIWQNVVVLANQYRVALVSAATVQIPGGTAPVSSIEYKPLDAQPKIPGIEVMSSGVVGGAVDSFSGFTYSAACSEVEVDILTGEVKLLRSDIMYDAGWSLNPAIDIGQVEGAFIQGVGYVLSESLVFQPDGDERGRLNTTNTWRYKPPATTTIPLELNVYLFPRELAGDVPENPNNLFSAKEIGEPPLVLANTVFFAIKAAIRASRLERGLPGLFRFDAPATVQEVRRACALPPTLGAGDKAPPG
jgi:xanthine dehydrogenase/oxidase